MHNIISRWLTLKMDKAYPLYWQARVKPRSRWQWLVLVIQDCSDFYTRGRTPSDLLYRRICTSPRLIQLVVSLRKKSYYIIDCIFDNTEILISYQSDVFSIRIWKRTFKKIGYYIKYNNRKAITANFMEKSENSLIFNCHR